MAANLQPITSDGGFTSGGNININSGSSIVTAINEDLTIVVQDEDDDGWTLKHRITDSIGNNLAETRLNSSSFTINTDMTGGDYSWQFDGNTLQVTNDTTIRGFNANVVTQALVSGGNPVARLQVVDGVNDPNIFSTFDATSSGANIKVYNGGSNGGVEYAWKFDNDGELTVAGNIIMADGATLKGTGASPAPNIYGFDSGSFGGNLSAANLTVVNLTANATALIGPSASANFTRFPNAQVVISNVAAGIQQNESGNIGLISETTANSANTSVRGVGVYGVGYTSGGASADGIDGEAHVSNTNDTGTATGVRGYSYDTHAGGINIGVYASALNGATNYALYMKHGNIISDDPQTWTLADNNASALSLNATGKTGILNIVTTNGAEGVTMSGTLSVTGNANVGNLNTTTATITTGNITTINSGLLQNGNSNITLTANGNVSIQAAGSNVELVVTSTGANVNGTLTSTGKIGYASGSTVTQTTNRGNGVTINALAGTIITTSATMVANQIDTFSVANDQVDPNNDIVLVQIVSPNFGVYNCIAQPSSTISVSLTGFYVNIVNISGFTTTSDAITIRFMVIKAPNA
jgi:hypothetical protein